MRQSMLKIAQLDFSLVIFKAHLGIHLSTMADQSAVTENVPGAADLYDLPSNSIKHWAKGSPSLPKNVARLRNCLRSQGSTWVIKCQDQQRSKLKVSKVSPRIVQGKQGLSKVSKVSPSKGSPTSARSVRGEKSKSKVN